MRIPVGWGRTQSWELEVTWAIYSIIFLFKHRCLLSTYVGPSMEPGDSSGFAEVASRWTEWSGMRPGTYPDGCRQPLRRHHTSHIPSWLCWALIICDMQYSVLTCFVSVFIVTLWSKYYWLFDSKGNWGPGRWGDLPNNSQDSALVHLSLCQCSGKGAGEWSLPSKGSC